MPLTGVERLVVGATAMVTVGSFALPSLATQDAALGGQTVYQPETQKPIIALGWVLTGATGIAAGLWAKNNGMLALGAAVAVGGLAWTYLLDHPVFNKDQSKPLELVYSRGV